MSVERRKRVQSGMLTVEKHFLTFDVGHSFFLKRRNEKFRILKLTITLDIQKPVNLAYGMYGATLCVSVKVQIVTSSSRRKYF